MGSKNPLFSHSHDLRWAAVLSAILLILGGAISGRVFAQAGDANENAAGAGASTGSYIEDPVDQNQKKNQKISPILRTGKFTDDQQQNEFDTYYKTYALSRWTQSSTLGDLNKYHLDLINNLRQAKSGQVHDHLNDLVLDYMGKLAKSDKYHPAVRYNAMLMIGDLNSVDNMPPAPSIPLEAALPVLLAAVNNANQIDAMKIAALIGINRHVTLGVNNPQIQSQIPTTMLKLAAGADSSDPGRKWMCKQAVEILGLLGNVGNNNQVVKTLSAIIGNAKVPFLTRRAAAEALGKMNYAGASGLNAVDLAKTLGQLMLDACSEELKSAKNTSMPVSRRRMKDQLGVVTESLKGVRQLAKDQPQQTYINDLQIIFDNLLKDLDNTKFENVELQKSVADCQTKLNGWLTRKP